MYIRLDKTCSACPEQYDAYDVHDNYVGYIRLRHGHFYVTSADQAEYLFEQSFPLTSSTATTPEEQHLLEVEDDPNPDGIFESPEQRDTYLGIAKQKIAEHILSSTR